MSLKEKAVLAVLATVVLYLIAGACWFLNLDPKRGWCPRSWATAMRQYEKACETYRSECSLISRRAELTEAYEAEKSAMPTFEFGRETGTTWLEKLDEIANRNHMDIADRQAGKENVVGDDVYELEITVNNCEGALESLVKFLYELETTGDGMFHITYLNVKPSSKAGYLRCSFTLKCAYMRK